MLGGDDCRTFRQVFAPAHFNARPQIIRIHHMEACACAANPAIAQRRGPSSSGLPKIRKTAVLT